MNLFCFPIDYVKNLTSLAYELQNVDVLNPFFLREIDETSWKSLSGVRANKRILQLVPNLEVHDDFMGFLLEDCLILLLSS